ncbi:hypothetical protein [Ruminococcus sp.]|nr:hypothetical protein [Ruminococcus sp.]
MSEIFARIESQLEPDDELTARVLAEAQKLSDEGRCAGTGAKLS